jgi:cobalamin biosynthesis protein CobT
MLNMMEMDRYIKAIAARGDLRVVWEDTETPRTDGRTIWLPRLTASADLPVYKKLRHYATHEVDHNLFTGFEGPWANVKPGVSFLGAIHNLVEDHRIEWLGVQDYEGDRLCSNDVHPAAMDHVRKSLQTAPQDVQDAVLPLLTWVNESFADFYPAAASVQPDLLSSLSALGKERLEKLSKFTPQLQQARDEWRKTEGTGGTYELAKRILKEVYEQDPEEEQKRCDEEAKKQQGKGNGKTGKEEGEGEGESDEKGEGQGGGEGNEPDTSDGHRNVDYSKFVPSIENDVASFSSVHFENMYTIDEQYNTVTPDQYQVRDFSKKSDKGTSEDSGCYRNYRSQIQDALTHTSAGFGHRVRTILQVRDRDRYQYGLKRGKLNVGSLHRIMVKDAPGYNERVFKHKQVSNVLDAAVSLLVDQSGSMGGSKYSHAAAAAVMLNNIIGNTLHIPTEILAFTTYADNLPRMYVHRKFSDKLVKPEDLMQRFHTAAMEGMGNNPDGDAVLFTFDRIMQRPEKRKLIVVFSDGQPAGGQGDVVWHLKHVVKHIEQDSPVDIVGIGLQDHSVTRFYKEHQVIHRADELENALLAVIENKLK